MCRCVLGACAIYRHNIKTRYVRMYLRTYVRTLVRSTSGASSPLLLLTNKGLARILLIFTPQCTNSSHLEWKPHLRFYFSPTKVLLRYSSFLLLSVVHHSPETQTRKNPSEADIRATSAATVFMFPVISSR